MDFNKLKKYFTNKKVVSAVVILVIMLGSLILLFRSTSKIESDVITEDQIRIEKDGKIIKINKNGLVEYQAEDKVFYKIWDTGRVKGFFDLMDKKVRDAINSNNQITPGCYIVTMYIDGKPIEVCINGNDPDLVEIYEDFDDTGSGGNSIGDLFDDIINNGDQIGSGGSNEVSGTVSATPTSFIFITPTTTPRGGAGDSTYYPVEADCSNWQKDIVGTKAIISNTLCIPIVELPKD